MAQILLSLAVALAVLLFFGPIVVITSIIGQVRIGSLNVDLSKTHLLGRLIIGLLGLGIWLSVYIPLFVIVSKESLPQSIISGHIQTTPASMETPISAGTIASPQQASLTRTPTPTTTPAPTRTPGLDANWKWIDPKGDSIYNLRPQIGLLSISTGAGHDLYAPNNYAAPRMLRSVPGNFDIVVVVRFQPSKFYQGAGILIWQDENNFLRLERAFGGNNEDYGPSGIRFDKQESGTFSVISPVSAIPTSSERVELRVQKIGKQFVAYWRLPNGNWQEVGKTTAQFSEQLNVGVAVVTWFDVPMTTADFEEIHFLPTP